MKLTLSSRDNALYPLLHFVLDDLPTRSQTPILDWCVERSRRPFSQLSPPFSSCPLHLLAHPCQQHICYQVEHARGARRRRPQANLGAHGRLHCLPCPGVPLATLTQGLLTPPRVAQARAPRLRHDAFSPSTPAAFFRLQIGYFPNPPLVGQPGILRLPKIEVVSSKVLQRSTANA